MNPFHNLVNDVVRFAAKQIVRFALEQLAFPKRPERTPRRLKKAARKALKSDPDFAL